MTLLPDPGDVARVEPRDDSGRVYLVRTPTKADQARFLTRVREEGGRFFGTDELLDSLGDAVTVLTEGDDSLADEAQLVLADLEDYRERQAEFRRTLRASELDGLDDAAKKKARREADRKSPRLRAWMDRAEAEYPPYVRRLASNANLDRVTSLAAANVFLVGWEGYATPFSRTPKEVPERLLRAIPDAHLEAIALKINELMEPAPDTEKNSGSRPGGAKGAKTSSSASEPVTPGEATS